MLCYCHSKKLFEQCCLPFIEHQTHPQTAEQLMRSRYSAYANKSYQYIIDTYSSDVRAQQNINDIAAWGETTTWRNLIIHSQPDKHQEADNIVEFSAYFIENKQLCVLRERSYFIKENQRWYYQTGDIIENKAFNKIKRNDICPCQQGKKFKHCCNHLIN